jgi:hypothetical protein
MRGGSNFDTTAEAASAERGGIANGFCKNPRIIKYKKMRVAINAKVRQNKKSV